MTLGAERRQSIAQFIRINRRATVEELSAQFGVSEATIRRDLEKLDGTGAIQRAHGGAVAIERAAPEPPVLRRASEHAEEKRQIGQAAAALIGDGETIFIGSGTTTAEVARCLEGKRDLKVITNALNVAVLLADNPNVSVIITGGLLRPTELSMIGYLAEQSLRELHADKVIIGIRAVSIAEGLTSDYGAETTVDRAIISCARQVVLVADHSKIGKVATVMVAPASAIHTLVTNPQAPSEVVEALRRLGVTVVLA